MEKYQMLCGKILFSSLSLFESETIFLQKLFQKEKKFKNYFYGFMVEEERLLYPQIFSHF